TNFCMSCRCDHARCDNCRNHPGFMFCEDSTCRKLYCKDCNDLARKSNTLVACNNKNDSPSYLMHLAADAKLSGHQRVIYEHRPPRDQRHTDPMVEMERTVSRHRLSAYSNSHYNNIE